MDNDRQPINFSPSIRLIDVRYDLPAIADLIELCFNDNLDPDGREYIEQIRRAAQDSRYRYWAQGAGERVNIPLHSYVWEENHRVIANLSLIPFYRKFNWYYLIANVAVHPDYRQRGIARQLTQKALEHVRTLNIVNSVWLHVRVDNPVAIHLYESLGFVERIRRVNWRNESQIPAPDHTHQTMFEITPRHKKDWLQHKKLLEADYPEQIAWYLNCNDNTFNPDFWNTLNRFFSGRTVHHWAIRRTAPRDHQVIGIATWETSPYSSDTLWLTADPTCEDETMPPLLSHVRHIMGEHRPLTLNYPVGRGEKTLQSLNFEIQNTLVWMEVKIK